MVNKDAKVWMVPILFITGLVLLFGILLGPYRVVLTLHGHDAEVTGTLRLAGLKQIFGFVWICGRTFQKIVFTENV